MTNIWKHTVSFCFKLSPAPMGGRPGVFLECRHFVADEGGPFPAQPAFFRRWAPFCPLIGRANRSFLSIRAGTI